MEDPRITAEQLLGEWQGDLRALAEEIAATMNAARAGRIIADTEEGVRDAQAVFRERAYQKAIGLLAQRAGQKAFSPSGQRGPGRLEEQGPAEDDARDRQRRAGR
jgi:hypothetical protein